MLHPCQLEGSFIDCFEMESAQIFYGLLVKSQNHNCSQETVSVVN